MTIRMLKSRPVIFAPFIVVAIAQAISLLLLYLAPQSPVSAILGPPIRVIFGDKFLHYPAHLTLLPKLFFYSKTVISVIFGVPMSGLAMGMLKDAYNGKKPGLLNNFLYILKRYFAVLAVWGLLFLIAKAIYLVPQYLAVNSTMIMFYIGFLLSFLFIGVIHAMMVYIVPFIITKQTTIIEAFKRGIALSRKAFASTALLVIAPSLLLLPTIILRINSGILMVRFFPEIILVILGIGIIISFIVDCIITCSTTLFLLEEGGR